MKPLSTTADLLRADWVEYESRCRKHRPAKTDKTSVAKVQRYRRDRVLLKTIEHKLNFHRKEVMKSILEGENQ